MIGDLRDTDVCNRAVDRKFDEIYQFAADMGGAGFVFTGENDADIMHNSVMCNIHMMDVAYKRDVYKRQVSRCLKHWPWQAI